MKEPVNIFRTFTQSPIQRYSITSLQQIRKNIQQWNEYLKHQDARISLIDQARDQNVRNITVLNKQLAGIVQRMLNTLPKKQQAKEAIPTQQQIKSSE